MLSFCFGVRRIMICSIRISFMVRKYLMSLCSGTIQSSSCSLRILTQTTAAQAFRLPLRLRAKLKGSDNVFLFILLFISLISGFVLAVRAMIKNKHFTVINIISVINFVLFLLIFIFSK